MAFRVQDGTGANLGQLVGYANGYGQQLGRQVSFLDAEGILWSVDADSGGAVLLACEVVWTGTGCTGLSYIVPQSSWNPQLPCRNAGSTTSPPIVYTTASAQTVSYASDGFSSYCHNESSTMTTSAYPVSGQHGTVSANGNGTFSPPLRIALQ